MIPIERRISDSTRLIDLTVGELKELFASMVPVVMPGTDKRTDGKRLVYGIQGIKDLFNCSEATARRLKNDLIKKAVKQVGRKIVVDADLALSLFKEGRG